MSLQTAPGWELCWAVLLTLLLVQTSPGAGGAEVIASGSTAVAWSFLRHQSKLKLGDTSVDVSGAHTRMMGAEYKIICC